MTEPLLLRNVRPWGADAIHMRLSDGAIVAVGPELDGDGAETLDGAGALVLPSLVDAHMHLDKTLWGEPWRDHPAGPTRDERIAADRRLRRDMADSIEQRAGALAAQAVRMGTGHIRSHVDVEPELGLRHVEALLNVRETFAGRIDLQLVAFPQFGMVTNPGTAELMEAAVRAGAEVVGGIDPAAIDRDRDGQLDAVFAIVERTGAMVDIHLHEMGEEGAASMAAICERTRALGMAGRVAISHAFCLGSVDAQHQARLIEGLAAAGVGVVTYAPGSSPVPSVKELNDAGVTLAVGSDGVRDTWTPYGNADMLERAMMLAYRSGFRKDAEIRLALEAVIEGGARLLGIDGLGLAPGCRADLLLVEAATMTEAVVARPAGRTVIKGGRVV